MDFPVDYQMLGVGLLVAGVCVVIVVGIILELLDQRSNTTRCPACSGKGYIRYGTDQPIDWNDDTVKQIRIIELDCAVCEGSGRVPYRMGRR